MYWWRASKLAEELREGRVTEKERFKYFLATFILWNVAVPLIVYSSGPFDFDRLISAALNLSVIVTGIILCYRVNKRGDDVDFIPRMICLGWPASVHFAVMVSSFCLGFGVLHSVPAASLGARSFWSVIPGNVRELWADIPWFWFVLGYYWSLSSYLIRVANTKEAETALQAKEIKQSEGGELILAVLGGIGVPIIMIFGGALSYRFLGSGKLSMLLSFLVVGLWMLLFIAILSRRKRQSSVKGVDEKERFRFLQDCDR